MERKLIEEHNYRGMILQIFEEGYHYVFYINGQRVFSNTDLDRVQAYLKSIMV